MIICSVLFCSCVWTPSQDLSGMRSKTTYKPIDSLNEPMALSMIMHQGFNLYGNENLESETEIVGSLVMIYDWQTDSVHDWFYVDGIRLNSYQEEYMLPALKNTAGDTSFVSFYSSGSRLLTVAPGSTSPQIKDESLDTDFYTSFSGGRNHSGRYALQVARKGYGGETGLYMEATVYDADAETFKEPIRMKDKIEWDMCDVAEDKDGNFWVLYDLDGGDAADAYTVIQKVDCGNNRLLDPIVEFNQSEGYTYDEMDGWSGSITYDLECVTDSYLILEKRVSEQNPVTKRVDVKERKLLFVSKTDGSIKKEIAITGSGDAPDEWYVRNVSEINGKVWIFVDGYDSKIRVYDLDLSQVETTSTLSVVKGTIQHFIPDSCTVRDNKIYFVQHGFNSLTLTSYDTVAEQFYCSKILSIEYLLEQ